MRAPSEHRSSFGAVYRRTALFLMFCCFPALAFAVFPHHDGVHKEIEGLEQEWREAQLTNDIATMDRLLSDDYLGISANGTLQTKADVLNSRRSGVLQITRLDLSDIKVRIYGDTAVVTSKADLVGRNGNRDISGRYRYTRVYSDHDGRWRIVSFEASRMSDENSGEPRQKRRSAKTLFLARGFALKA